MIHHNIPLRPWEVLGAVVFHFNNKNYLCVVEYLSKFPVIKRIEGLSTESLITTTKVIFEEYGISHKIMSDAGTNFFQASSESSAAGSTSSKQCHQHITTRAIGRSNPTLNSLNAHLKMCWLWWGHSHGIITNPYYPTGVRFAESDNTAI